MCTLSGCAVGQECMANSCTDAELAIAVPTPRPVVGYLPVSIAMQIVRADGGTATGVRLPMVVDLVAAPGLLNLLDGGTATVAVPAGNFSFSITAAPGANGQATVSASFDAGTRMVTGTLAVDVDTSAPAVTIEVLQVDAGHPASWAFGSTSASTARRDEKTYVKVSAGEQLTGVTLNVGDATTTLVASGSCPTCMTNCYCFEAELWRPTMNGLAVTFPVRVSGTDVRGVPLDGGLAPDGGAPGVNVTRLRWRVQPTPTLAIRAAPVLDDEGNVYVGRVDGTLTSGDIQAITPGGGTKLGWGSGVSAGAVTSLAFWRGPDAGAGATLDDVIYFNANTNDGGVLRAVGVDGVLAAGYCGGSASAGQPTDTAIALVPDGLALAAVAHFSSFGGANGAMCMWQPSAGTSLSLQTLSEDTAPAPQPSVTQAVQNLIVTKANGGIPTNIINVGRNSGLTTRRRTVLGLNSFDFSIDLNAPAIGTGSSTSAGISFLSGGSLGTFGPFAMSGAVNAASLYRVQSGAAMPSSSFLDTTSPAVVSRGRIAWAHSADQVRQTDFTATVIAGASFMGSVTASPVLTQTSAGAEDRMYLVTTAGTLGSLRLASAAQMEWQGDTGLGTGVSASPAFDCNRLATGTAKAATGVLYLASGGGLVMAVIVDSPKLDTQAKWPKYQRDAFNSGNTFLSFDSCP